MPPPEPALAPPVVWADGRHGQIVGRVAEIPIFTLDWSISRGDAEAGTPYILRCHLPGYQRKTWTVDREGGERIAGQVMAKWFGLLLEAAQSASA